jgi:hypothetical protein
MNGYRHQKTVGQSYVSIRTPLSHDVDFANVHPWISGEGLERV